MLGAERKESNDRQMPFFPISVFRYTSHLRKKTETSLLSPTDHPLSLSLGITFHTFFTHTHATHRNTKRTTMSVLETFEKYQKSRVAFVQKVASLACTSSLSLSLRSRPRPLADDSDLSTVPLLPLLHAARPQNIASLQDAGVMRLLRPLLLDVVPSVQQSAAMALGRLANHSEDLAEDGTSSVTSLSLSLVV